MRVQVRLFSTFRQMLPHESHGQADLVLPEGATIGQVLAALGVKDPVKLITVNGAAVSDLKQVLADGDQLQIFPPVVGG